VMCPARERYFTSGSQPSNSSSTTSMEATVKV